MRARQTRIENGVTLFLCGNPGCGEWLPKEGYYKNSTTKNKISSYCKQCLRKYSNEKRIKKVKEVKIDVETGLRCFDCTVIFNLPNNKKVVCKSCAARRTLKGLPKLPITKFKELGD